MNIDVNQILEVAIGIAAFLLTAAGLFVKRANEAVIAARLTPSAEDDVEAERYLAIAVTWQGRAQLVVDVLTLGVSRALRTSIVSTGMTYAARTSSQGPTPHYERVRDGSPVEDTSPDRPSNIGSER